MPIKKDVPLSNFIDISLVPRHFPVQGCVSILPVVAQNDCAIIFIFSCIDKFSYFLAMSTAFCCNAVRFVSGAFCSCSSVMGASISASFGINISDISVITAYSVSVINLKASILLNL